MNSPSVTGVTPSVRYRMPPAMFVIWKSTTLPASRAFGVMTSPDVDWLFCTTVAPVTVGASATGVTTNWPGT